MFMLCRRYWLSPFLWDINIYCLLYLHNSLTQKIAQEKRKPRYTKHDHVFYALCLWNLLREKHHLRPALPSASPSASATLTKLASGSRTTHSLVIALKKAAKGIKKKRTRRWGQRKGRIAKRDERIHHQVCKRGCAKRKHFLCRIIR